MNHQIPEYTLNDGLKVPAIGFGTYSLKGEEGVKSIASAMDAGYRLIDTAYNYENEATVGRAIKQAPSPEKNCSFPRSCRGVITLMIKHLWRSRNPCTERI